MQGGKKGRMEGGREKEREEGKKQGGHPLSTQEQLAEHVVVHPGGFFPSHR